MGSSSSGCFLLVALRCPRYLKTSPSSPSRAVRPAEGQRGKAGMRWECGARLTARYTPGTAKGMLRSSRAFRTQLVWCWPRRVTLPDCSLQGTGPACTCDRDPDTEPGTEQKLKAKCRQAGRAGRSTARGGAPRLAGGAAGPWRREMGRKDSRSRTHETGRAQEPGAQSSQGKHGGPRSWLVSRSWCTQLRWPHAGLLTHTACWPSQQPSGHVVEHPACRWDVRCGPRGWLRRAAGPRHPQPRAELQAHLHCL